MKNLSQLKSVKREQVNRIYSGRPGCMCGCRGKYFEPDSRSFKSVFNSMVKMAEAQGGVEVDIGLGDDVQIFFVDNEQRIYAIYLKEEV